MRVFRLDDLSYYGRHEHAMEGMSMQWNGIIQAVHIPITGIQIGCRMRKI
ncbi:hypothetical protein [Vibrio coralliilyticus]|nr:hypothetical protein [Vibrio coralliilyticus]